MTPVATIVDWSSLAEAAYVSVAVGLGVTVACVLALVGAIGAGIYLLTQ